MRIIPLLALLALTAPLATAQTGKVIAPPPDVAAALCGRRKDAVWASRPR